MAGLTGDGVSVGAVAGALGDEACPEEVPAKAFGNRGVVSGVFGAAADGFVDRGSGRAEAPGLPLLAMARNNGAWAAGRGTSPRQEKLSCRWIESTLMAARSSLLHAQVVSAGPT